MSNSNYEMSQELLLDFPQIRTLEISQMIPSPAKSKYANLH